MGLDSPRTHINSSWPKEMRYKIKYFMRIETIVYDQEPHSVTVWFYSILKFVLVTFSVHI